MLKLHHAPNSRAGRIVWLLEELQLPYELNRRLGCVPDEMTHLHAYVNRLEARPAFQKGVST